MSCVYVLASKCFERQHKEDNADQKRAKSDCGEEAWESMDESEVLLDFDRQGKCVCRDGGNYSMYFLICQYSRY